MKLVNFFHKKSLNVGDANSSPLLYFPIQGQSLDYSEAESSGKCDAVIFGGGIIPWAASKLLRKLKPKHSVVWGCAVTSPKLARFDYQRADFLKRMTLVGIRDHGTRYCHVPCPSCMSPLFDSDYPIQHEVVFFENSAKMRLDTHEPLRSNTDLDFAATLRFLASGQTVVTSSYHGLYWALLLKRRVLAIPFGAKFFGFPFKVETTTATAWRSQLAKATHAPSFLEECRALNCTFYKRVQALLSR